MKFRGALLALLGAIGTMAACNTAQARQVVGETYASHEEEMAWRSARQSHTIEALEDFLWRYPPGGSLSKFRMLAVDLLSEFGCSPNCNPNQGGNGRNRDGRYGG
jgi:hypothetical protein